MRERKNDPVLIGFHENLLLNNGNLLSTLGSIEWERASDCFVWVEAWVGVVSRHCCILSQCDIFYRESSRVRGLLSSYAMANNINTSRRLIFYLTLFFFFPFFFVELVLLLLFCLFLLFYEGSTLSIAQTVKNNVTRVSLYILTVIIVNVHAAQFTRSSRSLTLCCLLWKK